MGQPSPYFIRPIEFETNGSEFEFEELAKENELWAKFPEYWRLLRKHLWLFPGVTFAILAVVGIKDLMAVRLYTATTTLLIHDRTPHLFADSGEGAVRGEDDLSLLFNPHDETEYELLRSRSIAASVIRSEGLLDTAPAPARTSNLLEQVRTWLNKSMPWLSNSGRTEARKTQNTLGVPSYAIDQYLGQVVVTPIEHTHMGRVSVTTTDPELSARLANAHARQFIRRGIELSAQATEDAESFLTGKLADLKRQVEHSELALNNYRRDKGIIPGLISVNGKEDVVIDHLNKISQDLQDAHLKSISLGTEVALIRDGREDALPEVINSPLIQKLKENLDNLRVQEAALGGKFTPDYPPMKELQAKIHGTELALAEELKNNVSEVREEYTAARDREGTLSKELDKQKSFALGLNDAAVRYLILEREAETNRELYNSVLKRMKDMALIADVHASKISIVDEAEPPGAPSYPKTKRDMLAAGVVGLALAFALAFVLERLDATFKFPDEAQQYLRIPSLAVIPEFSLANPRFYGVKAGDHLVPSGPAHSKDIVTTLGKYSVLSEAYRTLRTGLLLSRAGAQPKITLITSALPHEGKTTVAINTAIVLAQTGAKVLLIDADLRKPRCHKVLSMKNHFGLTEILTGVADDNAVSATKIDNLELLSSGKIPPSPSELLGSSKMRETLKHFAEIYDYIVIDSPPVMVVSDAIMLSVMSDGVVLVTAGGETPKQQARAAVTGLRQAQARIFGFVLNRVKIHKFDYAYYHYSNMYHGYYGNSETADETTETESSEPA